MGNVRSAVSFFLSIKFEISTAPEPAPATLQDPRGSCTCDIECVRACVGAWMVYPCVRSCVRACCCVWCGWRWLTSFDLTSDAPTGTVGRQSLPISQSAFDVIFHLAHESGRCVVALSTANHFAMTPSRSPPNVPSADPREKFEAKNPAP